VNYKVTTNSIWSLCVFNDLKIGVTNMLRKRRHYLLQCVSGNSSHYWSNT